MQFEMLKDDASIIKVIGVGGGGGNAINHMYKQGIKGVDFIICNTDAQALELSPVPNKIQLGSTLTEGRGAGSMPEVGKHSAIENIDQIKMLLGNTKMVFITAGMGGGTGTGASPIIAQACRELGILTVGIVTTPFAFEGKRRRLQAEDGLEELKKHVDTLLVISNDKMREMFGNLTLTSAFNQADDILTTAAKGIAEIITVPGYINVDFEDVRTVMAGSGAAIMGSCTSVGEDRARKAVVGALSSPLLNDNEIEGARYILLNISSGVNEVLMDEVTVITDYIQEEAGLTADIIWGNCFDSTLEDELCVTIIATGFQTRKEKEIGRQKAPERTVKVLAFDDVPDETYLQPGSRPGRDSVPAREKVPARDYNVTAIETTVRETTIRQVSPAASEGQPAEPYLKKETVTPIREPAGEDHSWLAQAQRKQAVENAAAERAAASVSAPGSAAERTAESYVIRPDGGGTSDPFLTVRPMENEERPKNRQVSIFDAVAKEDNDPRIEKPENLLLKKDVPSQKIEPVAPPANEGAESDEDPMRKTRERIMRLKELSMKLRTSKGIEDLENVPAYIRKQQKLDKVPYSSQDDESRFTSDDRGEIRPNNSFLHDNVD